MYTENLRLAGTVKIISGYRLVIRKKFIMIYILDNKT